MADEVRQANGAVGVLEHRGGCVVLSPPGSALLGVLLPALTRRWGSLSVVSDEPAVMEALAGGGVSVVVVVEPGSWGHLRPLAVAMGRYFGRVLCMKFEVAQGEDEPRITSLASRWLGADGPVATNAAQETPGAPGPSLAGSGAGVGSHAWAAAGRDDMLALPVDAGADRAAVGAELDADEAVMSRGVRQKVGGLAVATPSGASADPGPPEALVTQEELSMLLGPSPAR